MIELKNISVPDFDEEVLKNAITEYFGEFADTLTFTKSVDMLHNQIGLTITKNGHDYNHLFHFHDERELTNLYHTFENLKGMIVRYEVQYLSNEKAAN